MSKNNKKTHWREAFDSDYLASWDIEKPTVLTVEKCVKEVAKLQRKEEKAVLYFKEAETPEGVTIKPMILNATNCKFIHLQTKLPFIDDWHGFKVEVSVVENKGRIGGSHGLRITKVLSGEPVDITFILENEDVNFVKREANKIHKQINEDQKKLIRNHIEKLENEV